MSATSGDLDPLPILSALGVDDVRAATRITTGIGGAALFRLERAATVQALRVYRPGATAAAEHERAAMEAARAAGVPIPTIDAEGEWSGRPVALLEWCDGVTMLEAIGLNPWRAFRLGRVLGRIQAGLHAAAPPAQDRRFRQGDWIDRFGEVDPPLRRWLTATSGRRALLHLDLHPLNVMVAGNRVTGVIDWENAMIGDPRADVARTWSLLRLAPLPPASRRPGTGPFRWTIERGWRRGYREVAGWPGDLEAFQAWAAEVMVRDLAPKIGQPGVWFRQEDLEPIRRIAADLRKRAGVDG